MILVAKPNLIFRNAKILVVEDFYVLSCIATIRLLLRRTLVRLGILFNTNISEACHQLTFICSFILARPRRTENSYS